MKSLTLAQVGVKRLRDSFGYCRAGSILELSGTVREFSFLTTAYFSGHPVLREHPLLPAWQYVWGSPRRGHVQ